MDKKKLSEWNSDGLSWTSVTFGILWDLSGLKFEVSILGTWGGIKTQTETATPASVNC